MKRVPSRGWAAAAIAASVVVAGGDARAAIVLPGPPPLDLQSVADRVHSFTVAVHTHAFVSNRAAGPGQKAPIMEAVNSASGILIGDGLVLTALSAVTFKRSDGQLEPPAEIDVVTDQAGIVPARFLVGDRALDLAVLQLPDQLHDLDGATLAPSDPTVGETMLAIGAQGDSLYVVGVSLERVEFATGGGTRLYVNRALPPSFWGGPLFDAEGHLAGVTSRPTPDSDSGYALPVSLLHGLIDRVKATTRT